MRKLTELEEQKVVSWYRGCLSKATNSVLGLVGNFFHQNSFPQLKFQILKEIGDSPKGMNDKVHKVDSLIVQIGKNVFEIYLSFYPTPLKVEICNQPVTKFPAISIEEWNYTTNKINLKKFLKSANKVEPKVFFIPETSAKTFYEEVEKDWDNLKDLDKLSWLKSPIISKETKALIKSVFLCLTGLAIEVDVNSVSTEESK